MDEDRKDLFIHITCDEGVSRASGSHRCVLGHRLPDHAGHGADGIFAEWSWDGAKLTFQNDRYGIYPVFYFQDERQIAISPSIERLLEVGAPAAPDWDAMSVFLRFGNFLGEDTPFAEIRAFPPKARCSWEHGHMQLESEMPIGKMSGLSRRAGMEGYLEIFRESMLRRDRWMEGSVLPLSGGRDSRHILLEMVESEKRPSSCVTVQYAPPNNNTGEVDVARKLAASCGVPLAVVPQAGSLLSTATRKNRGTNFTSLQHGWYLTLVDSVSDRGGAIFDGLAGDVLSAGLFLDQETQEVCESGKLEEVARHWLGLTEPSTVDLPSLNRAARATLSQERAIARLIEELAKHTGAPNPVSSFVLCNRTRRGVAGPLAGLWGPDREVIVPFLDHAVHDLLASLPAEYFLDHSFHTEALKLGYPQFAQIPYSENRQTTGESTRGYRRATWDVLRFLGWGRRPGLVRTSYLAPRLWRFLVQSGHRRDLNWLVDQNVYLSQLEGLWTGL